MINETPDILAYTSNASSYDLTSTGLTSTASTLGTNFLQFQPVTLGQIQPIQTDIMPNSNRRIVQVFIADPNESVPLENSILYQDEKPHLTDLTDQELFFEIDIKNILEKHNAVRITLDDRETFDSNQVRKLEPAKIRDLKITVVTVAQF